MKLCNVKKSLHNYNLNCLLVHNIVYYYGIFSNVSCEKFNVFFFLFYNRSKKVLFNTFFHRGCERMSSTHPPPRYWQHYHIRTYCLYTKVE